MVPRPEGPISPGGSPDAERATAETRDPVRFAAQLALAIYLSPVFLAVCLIGGASILAGAMARAVRHGNRRPTVRAVAGPKLANLGPGHAPGRVAGRDRASDATH